MSDTASDQPQPSAVSVVAPPTDTNTVTATSGGILSTLEADASNIVQRTLAAVSADYEAAVTDLENFVKSKESYIETFIADEYAALKARAEAAFAAAITQKTSLVTTLEAELSKVGSWLSTKFHSIISAL